MRSLIKTRPYNAPDILGRDALDLLFGNFWNDPVPIVERSTKGYPITDLFYDENGNQKIEMALAGFSRECIKIEVKDNTITISGNNKEPNEQTEHRRIAKRSFTKTFIDYDNKLDLNSTEATFENGLLSLTLPGTPEGNPKLINIK